MTAPNHILGGVVVTGVFGGMTNVNILEDWKYIVICIVAALLPDIDHPGSIIGRTVLPLSKFINRNYGHRTITHSLAALVVVTLAMWLVAYWGALDGPYTFLVFSGYLSHLIFDMMTVAGVPLFYPWVMNPCVIPGKPEARFVVADVKSEIRIFAFFGLSFFLLQPLMSNGFWTQYNRLFGTLQHLTSEYNKSPKLLEVEYEYKQGSTQYHGKGYVIESSADKATLLQSDQFFFLDKSKMQAIKVYPTKTKLDFQFVNKSFIHIAVDSLHKLLVDSLIIEAEINANNEFRFSTGETGKKFKGKYLTNFYVDELLQNQDYKLEQYEAKVNPRIATLEAKVKKLKKEEAALITQIQNEKKQQQQLKEKLQTETDLYQREKLIQEIEKTQKQLELKFDSNKILDIEAQIRELKTKDRERNKESRGAVTRKNQAMIEQHRREPTRFTGVVTYLSIR